MIKFRKIIKQKDNTGWVGYYRIEEPKVSFWHRTHLCTSYTEASDAVTHATNSIQLSKYLYDAMYLTNQERLNS